MTILLVPDSFKDSLTASEVVKYLQEGFEQINPALQIQSYIASDGGEGFLDAVQPYTNAEPVICDTQDPLGRLLKANYLINSARDTAYIELAKASGIELLDTKERNPMYTSTYGTGLQIKDAISRGATTIYVGLGGSATNDAGIGMAAALGYTFLDKNDQVIAPQGQYLKDIASISLPNAPHEVSVIAINDVQNPLFGSQGAAHIYAQQKGASDIEISQLDSGLKHLSKIVYRDLKVDFSELPGAGAAGGTGYGLASFCGARFTAGMQFVLGIAGIEEQLKLGAIDAIITGEGSIDDQTMHGKLVKGVSQMGNHYQVPVYGVCGISQLQRYTLKDLGLKRVFSVADLASSTADSFNNVIQYIKVITRLIYSDLYLMSFFALVILAISIVRF